MMLWKSTTSTLAVALLAFAPSARAQDVTFTGMAGSPGRHIAMQFRDGEAMDLAPVKGSPFCATVVTEQTQVFADGNRIHNTENSSVCRDAEGRTRREMQPKLLGAVPQGAIPKIITITDPIAGFRFVLDTRAKVAQKMSLGPKSVSGVPPKGIQGNVVFFQRSGVISGEPPEAIGGGPVVSEKRMIANGDAGDQNPSTTENLGQQTINGMRATGTRVTTTIPAGQVGNEEPITITSERWYSPDLKATIMTKHSDPWAGTITTQFTNVDTSGPDPSLFTVPANYKIVDANKGPYRIKVQELPPGPPAQ